MKNYAGTNALIIGLAKSGVAAARLLDKLGAKTTVTDLKGESDLAAFVGDLPANTIRRLGGHEGINPKDYNLAVISPGVPWDAKFPQAVREAGVEMISELELGFTNINAPVIAITGANGKTTTTTLTGRMMNAAGNKTYVGGNIGEPLCDAAYGDFNWIVAEVSSFQLEGIKAFRPKVSAVLNVTPDHMDRHKTMETYAALKSRVFENQREGDTLVLNAEDPLTKTLSPNPAVKTLWFGHAKHGKPGAWVENGVVMTNIGNSEIKLFELSDIKVPGVHNVENAMAAALLSLAAGASPEAVNATIKSFDGLPHRMEKAGVVNGVIFINDSKGTNTDASIKSLSGFSGNVVVIAGGSSKGADFSTFAESVKAHAKGAVLIGKTAPEIEKALGGFTPKPRAANMEDAVRLAASMCAPGDTVLLSPACASFDMFKNYEHRGQTFKDAVAALSAEVAQCR